MGRKFKSWQARASGTPSSLSDVQALLLRNRAFEPIDRLDYGDHGLDKAIETIANAIGAGKRIALYADYDVDGTMSCVSWIWFLGAIGYTNFVHYIPCRFKEGYGLNLEAVRHLIEDEGAELIITMDTGITANEEAAYCRSRGVEFVCTDHHKIQPDRMPDCVILNPKQHPDPRYQELCGCGITFVLLRRLAERFPGARASWNEVWTDLLALVGMATICDVVPLNGVNHKLAKLGVDALLRSRRPVLRRLREASSTLKSVDETDVGFRLGPRINAVGRLEHADLVIKAFIDEDPEPLIERMGECNDRRKKIQSDIVTEARLLAREARDAPVLFLGGNWHPGVVGIAASKIAEEFWRPTWLFQRKDGVCKGSARSILGFDVTDAMSAAAKHFKKFGGHRAAGGFAFREEEEDVIRAKLYEYAEAIRAESPTLWESRLLYDCDLPSELARLELAEGLESLKPFGNSFEEPRFCLSADVLGVSFYRCKETGAPKHTAVTIRAGDRLAQKLMFFNEVHEELLEAPRARFVVSASRNTFRGQTSLSLTGHDWEITPS